MTKAIIIAGTQSGCGKTTVTLGLMAALTQAGLRVQPFKCGPDFIDPTLHRLVTGVHSRNLDMWMAGEEFSLYTFTRHSHAADIAVIEGVMGMFDGGDSSSAALADKLGIPVVLVLDISSAAESVAAQLKGFETLQPQMAPRAVILNKVASARHLDLVTESINKYCQAEILGHLPRNLQFDIPERHLGLHMGDEDPISPAAIKELGATMKEHINLDRLMAIAGTIATTVAPPLPVTVKSRIAVARDKAFCFYYEDNLDLLREAGAELLFFSPLVDKKLPANIDGVYLGGGYPELYAKDLSGNTAMLMAIRDWAENNGPIYAECGGFMYLSKGIVSHDEQFYAMAGIFPVQARMQKRRASLGYREIKLNDNGLFGPAGTVMRGHEFHYSIIAKMDASIKRLYSVNNGTEEGYCYKNVLGGYMHLHFGFNSRAAAEFVKKCM